MKSLAVVSRILVGSIIGFSLLNVASPGASRCWPSLLVWDEYSPGLDVRLNPQCRCLFRNLGPGRGGACVSW